MDCEQIFDEDKSTARYKSDTPFLIIFFNHGLKI